MKGITFGDYHSFGDLKLILQHEENKTVPAMFDRHGGKGNGKR